tara:strand:- start:205 stop:588 length:384 start_codon:yes stop_codon:yes gene_type:complete
MKGRTIDSRQRSEIIEDWLLRNGDVSSKEYERKYNISKECICTILDEAVEIMKQNYREKTGGISLALRMLKKEYKAKELNPMELRKKTMKRFIELRKNSSSGISLERWSKMLGVEIYILKEAINRYG